MFWHAIITFFSHSARKHCILLFGCIALCFAAIAPDAATWWKDYLFLMTHQTYLMHDFIEVAGVSATFVNVAFHFFIAYRLFLLNKKSNVSGLQVAAIGIFVGHSFFGTHLLNIAPIMLGVFLYSRWKQQSFHFYTAISLFSTALAPIVSFCMFSPQLSVTSFLMGSIVGIILGFIAPPLAEHFLKFHQGFTLYNFGFTTGIIATFVALFIPYFNIPLSPVWHISSTAHPILLSYVICILVLLLLLSLTNAKKYKQYPLLLKSSGRVPDDFISKFGSHTSALNMVLTAGCYTFVLVCMGVQFNGPIVGSLISLTGFSAFGKHPSNCIPVSFGVWIASWLMAFDPHSLGFIFPFIFGTALAPITGTYGFAWGALAGFLHFNLTQNVFSLHGGMTLYNNGFATGFIAAFLIPVIEVLYEKRTIIKK